MAARLLALGAIVPVASACGAEAVPSEGGPAVGTARYESIVRFSDSGTEGEHEMRSTGEIDFAGRRSSDVDLKTGCESIAIGDVFYSEMPASGMPEGKRWLESSTGGVDQEAEFEETLKPQVNSDGSTTMSAIVVSLPEPAPDEYLAHLRTQGEVDRVGEEEVRGVPTTRYHTTFDRDKWTREQLELAGWKAANIERYLEQIRFDPEEDIQVWVDAAERTRRVVTTMITEAAGDTERMVDTVEYFDFGAKVTISAPPAGEVIDSGEWERFVATELAPSVDQPVQPTCKG